MDSLCSKIIDKVIGIEGDYSNYIEDPGGKTRFGITEEVARMNGYDGDMTELPVDFARQVYKYDYWDPMNLDYFASVSKDLAYELFECGVNAGTTRSGKFLQEALNAFNNQEDLYYDLEEDGIIGPRTIAAFSKYYEYRKEEGVNTLVKALNILQGRHYLSLVKADKKFEKFVYGWIKQRIQFNNYW